MSIVVTNPPRVDSALVEQFNKLGVATVHEAQERKGLMSADIKPIFRPSEIVGTAVTCEVSPGDNWMIHVAVEQCQKGDILVVSPTSPCSDGYFGDLLAESLRAHGVRGLIMNAGVRDIATLTEMRFPVWSATVFAQGTVKETTANVNTPIVCGGTLVNPGDLIVADDDGVVVVHQKDVETTLKNAQAREANESAKRDRLASGELGLDIYNMRERLTAKGLTYIDYKKWQESK
jgi:4-hydroxy-4-methyl-2-oxoglutarate aldolase